MADNKIDEAFNKAAEIADKELNQNQPVAPVINYQIEGDIVAGGTVKSIVSITPNDFANTLVRVKGTISNPENVTMQYKEGDTLKDLPLDTDGTFWFGPSTGFPLTDAVSEFYTKINETATGTLTIKLEVVNVTDSIVLCEAENTVEFKKSTNTVKIIPGKNIVSSNVTLTINGEKKPFNTVIDYAPNAELEITVEQKGCVTYVNKVTLDSDLELTVNLELAKILVTINNSVNADTVDIHIVNDNQTVHYNKPFEITYGSKVIVTAKKKGYKDYTYTIDKLEEPVTIDINEMEKVKYNLTISTSETAKIKVNGTENTVWPLSFDADSVVEYEVSKLHYETIHGTITMNEDKVLDLSMELEKLDLVVTTVPTDAEVTINNKKTRTERITYGSEITVVVSKTGYVNYEETFVINDNKTINVELEKQQVKLSFALKGAGSLEGATFIVNGNIVEQESFVEYGSENTVVVSKPGYKSFETIVIPTEDTIIYVDAENEWRKPQVTVNISNIQDIENTPVILIDNKPVSIGSPADVNYGEEFTINISCDGYETITETLTITDDYHATYELVDVNSGKVKLSVVCTVEGVKIFIDDVLSTVKYVLPGTEVTVKITHVGYETIEETFVVEHDMNKVYELVDLTPKKFKITISPIPQTSTVKINNEERKSITANYLDVIDVEVVCESYITKNLQHEVVANKIIEMKLDKDPDYTLPGIKPEDVTLDDIIKMLKQRANYSYIYISRYLKFGYTEENIRKFYERFGSYVSSTFDFRLWRMMHAYFGHIDNIPEPDDCDNKNDNKND